MLVAGQDCAYLRWADVGWRMRQAPRGHGDRDVRVPVTVRRPAAADSTVVIFRAGPGVTTLTARVADGRTVPALVGTDGWGIVARDGRIVAVGESPTG